jgi:hypothetical protein
MHHHVCLCLCIYVSVCVYANRAYPLYDTQGKPGWDLEQSREKGLYAAAVAIGWGSQVSAVPANVCPVQLGGTNRLQWYTSGTAALSHAVACCQTGECGLGGV